MKSIYGITPAGAGKSFFQSVLYALTRDHPRRCGEKEELGIDAIRWFGSPPQVRGKEKGFEIPCDKWGITPAGAGKSFR